MWGIIATWRMAVEGISKASQVLAEGGDAGDAIEIAVREVERTFRTISQLDMAGCQTKKWKLN